VICGAGIAGLALAQNLDNLGWEVLVLERAPGPRAQGYMIDFFGPGWEAAQAMGVTAGIERLGYRIDEAAWLDDCGRTRARLRYERFARNIARVAGGLVSIMRPDLEQALREHLKDNVRIRYAISVADVCDRGEAVELRLTDGSRLTADLLVGADGIHSRVRVLVFGPEQRCLRYLGFHTAAFTFTDAGLRERVGSRFVLTDTLDRQMGFYGLRDGRVATFAVHRCAAPALPADARAAVMDEYRDLGWIVPQALAACPPSAEIYYDQVAQVELPGWSRGRVTLLGDACQAVSLLAGQGASLAVAGAYLLAQQLAQFDTVEAALDRYERLWKPIVEGKQRTARAMIPWFLPNSPWKLRARHVALALAQLPVLDRYLAVGLAGGPTPPIVELASAPSALTASGGPGRRPQDSRRGGSSPPEEPV
jgi:2-polyprenyl-6-methoxyphenol hydroxylase-like FAD-dependent oxidoreductase